MSWLRVLIISMALVMTATGCDNSEEREEDTAQFEVDYDRARDFARLVANKVSGEQLEARWSPDARSLVFRSVTSAQSSEVVWLDTATQKRHPAFDTDRLAALVGGEPPDVRTFTFDAAGSLWLLVDASAGCRHIVDGAATGNGGDAAQYADHLRIG